MEIANWNWESKSEIENENRNTKLKIKITCVPYRGTFVKDEKLFQIWLLFVPIVNLN